MFAYEIERAFFLLFRFLIQVFLASFNPDLLTDIS